MLPTSTMTAFQGRLMGLGSDADYAIRGAGGSWDVSATARSIAQGDGVMLWDGLSLQDKQSYILRARSALTALPEYEGTTEDDPSAGQESYSEGFKTYYGTDWSPMDVVSSVKESIQQGGRVMKYLPWAVGGLVLYKVAKLAKVI